MEKTQVFVVDASVALKWYVRESLREKALQIRDDFISGVVELEAPDLLLYEVGNALRFHPDSTRALCSNAVMHLLNLGVAIHDLDIAIADMAASVAYEEKLTFYDSIYLALAKIIGATFITADGELIRHLSEKNAEHTKLLADYVSPRKKSDIGADNSDEG